MGSVREVVIVPSGPDSLFGVQGINQEADQIRATMPISPRLTGPDGRPAAGGLGVLVDNVLGYALMSSLPPGAWSISTEIWIDMLGPLPTDSWLTADARPMQAGAFAAGHVVDATGRVVAACRQRGRQVSEGPDLEQFAPETEPSTDVEDLGDLLGLRANGGAHKLEMTSALANPRRMLHGGVSLAASEVVATRSRVESGCTLATTSLHIVHTRGVPIGAQVEFEAITSHAGRTLWLTDVVGRVDGKVCTTTRVTAG